VTTSDNDGTYVLVRNEVGHMVQRWIPPSQPQDAIQHAYVEALGAPAPDSWRESLAELVQAAIAARQALGRIGQVALTARATPYQPGKWAEFCTSIAAQADAAAPGAAQTATPGDGLAEQLANLQLRLDLLNQSADELSVSRDHWLREARESERKLRAVQADAAALRGAIRAWHGDIVAAQWPEGLIGPRTRDMLDAAAAEHPGSDLLVIARAARTYQQAVQGLDGVQVAEAALFAALDAAVKGNGHG